MIPQRVPILQGGPDAYLDFDFRFGQEAYWINRQRYGDFSLVPGAISTGGAGFGTVQRNGVWQSVPANAPLIGDGGLRGAEGRTNVQTTPLANQRYPEGASGPGFSWVNGYASPDGATNAARLTDSDTSSRVPLSVSSFFATTPGLTYTAIFGLLKASGQTDAEGAARPVLCRVTRPGPTFSQLSFNAFSGSFGDVSGGTTASVTDMGSWWRIAITFTATAVTGTSATLQVFPAHNNLASNTGFVDFWFSNFSEGPDINDPPILQTSGLAATRTAMEYSQVLPAGDSTDIITVEYTGGTSTFARSTLADPLLLPYGVSSGGAWVNKQIQRIRLRAA